MARFKDYCPSGVIPAVLLPFDEDFSIDVAATSSHLRDVAGVAGITAITVNGHSTEVHACDADEQRRLVEIAMDEVGDALPVISGIYADGSLQAARLARTAADAGASALSIDAGRTLVLDGDAVITAANHADIAIVGRPVQAVDAHE